ncbi:MAG TPA: hypothetical protein EYQ14_13680 [Gammaproteobacteria bacterium]|nr:hypothetical protein [Gammaproteobacteria bacterium]HIL97862.1 hypothetical protein [Pseudomonadales bacterium]
MRLYRLPVVSLITGLVFLLVEPAMADQVQVATVTVREQNSLVRELLAEITAPQRQTIAAEIQGVVSSNRLEMGTSVVEGQVVVEIDSNEQQAVVAIAVSQLASTGIELAHAQRSLLRAKKNRNQNAMSESQFDEFSTAFDKAKVNRELAAGRVKLEQTRLEKYRVKTPFSGELVTATPVVGQYVRSGDAVFEVVNLLIRRVVLQLTSSELSSYQRGDYGLICDGEMMTTISVSPVEESNTGMASMELHGCGDTLRPGQHVGVDLVKLNAPYIPDYGIHKDIYGTFVYVVRQGRVGRTLYSRLKLGDRVIVVGAEQVKIGDMVTSIEVDAES